MNRFLKDTVLAPESGLRLLASWFFCCSLFEIFRLVYLPSIPLFVLFLVIGFTLLSVVQHYTAWPRLTAVALAMSASFYAFVLVAYRTTTTSFPLLVLIVFALGLVLLPLLHRERGALLPVPVSRRLCLAACLAVGVFFTVVLGTISCLRYLTFSSPNYDFGIFCQMFHNMKETLLPTVSCERNEIMSHFAVHISPIYYVLLPVYALFPSPLTLQISQTLILVSGIIPLYRLARHFRLSYAMTVLCVLLYATYPAVSTGCFYDIHENCFLVPLLLWLFVCYEQQHTRLMWIPACLILAVKEDAAVYLAFFALYIWWIRRDAKRGIPLLCAAVLWFAVAVFLLQQFGTGAMFGRYRDLLNSARETGGLFGTLLRDPALFLEQMVRETTLSQKIIWLLQLLLPLGALLWTPRGHYGRLFLLCPLLLNLLTHYAYQFNINFQYTFGVIPFLLYLLLQNAADNPPKFRRNQLIFGAITACLMYTMLVMPTFSHYVGGYVQRYDTYTALETALDTIPDNVSVTASTTLVAHLSQRRELYEDVYHKEPDTAYVALDLRGAFQPQSEKYRTLCVKKGYTVVKETDGIILILKAPNTH